MCSHDATTSASSAPESRVPQPATADRTSYLSALAALMSRPWPDNRSIRIACHGHSVPAGYFATPMVDTFHAYPHLLHLALKERHPFAVINVVVTGIGGEDSESGFERFERDVLTLRPDLVTIDYALNDRRIGLDRARNAWEGMIGLAARHQVPLILLTPTWDREETGTGDSALQRHAEQIRLLAAKHHVGLADPFDAFLHHVRQGGHAGELLSFVNHPSSQGHALVRNEMLRWFPL